MDDSSSIVAPKNSLPLSPDFKQFFLESERVEFAFTALEKRFANVQDLIHQANNRMTGKLEELDFVSRYLSAILNHMSQGIIFLDSNGIVTTYNTAAVNLLKIPENDLLFHPLIDFFEDRFFGFSLSEALHKKECPTVSSLSWKQNDQVLEIEVEAAFVPLHPFSMVATSVSSAPSQNFGLLLLLRDMTQIRRLQENAFHNERLKELGELAAHLAHEIRNPLGGIKGFANLLKQELKDRIDLQQMATNIIQGSDELNRFVTQILHYSRPFQVHFERINMIDLINELGQLIQADPMWTSKHELRILSQQEKVWVSIDPHLFRSALLNLFVNACQAMPEGGCLSVEIVVDLSFLTIRICDTGYGIPTEILPKIFSPFFTTKKEGTGLGLSEVQKVVQAHQGWIQVESEPGKGSKFILKIPLKME